jgi:hypothetical protein
MTNNTKWNLSIKIVYMSVIIGIRPVTKSNKKQNKNKEKTQTCDIAAFKILEASQHYTNHLKGKYET